MKNDDVTMLKRKIITYATFLLLGIIFFIISVICASVDKKENNTINKKEAMILNK